MSQPLPSWDEVLYHCIHSKHLIDNFNHECDCKLIFHQLPDLVNNQPYLKGEERQQVDMLIDYLLNFVYVPIIMTNDFTHPPIAFKL